MKFNRKSADGPGFDRIVTDPNAKCVHCGGVAEVFLLTDDCEKEFCLGCGQQELLGTADDAGAR